ncbi:hypothetical protein [Tenacibaculum sp. SG-28]|uniref:hypothetical protein n=1 Tax=Tenacibaculum sp. SG-28 TaxID=754426 RepID=UPI001304D113|nr:hypothetical protein [Tenacibaculum sp. SG-28]
MLEIQSSYKQELVSQEKEAFYYTKESVISGRITNITDYMQQTLLEICAFERMNQLYQC